MIQAKDRTPQQRLTAWRGNIPDLFHGSYRKLWDKAIAKKSMRAAIDSKCLDCCNWQQAEVKRCEVITCPLHAYRPYQDRAVASNLARQNGHGDLPEKQTPELRATT